MDMSASCIVNFNRLSINDSRSLINDKSIDSSSSDIDSTKWPESSLQGCDVVPTWPKNMTERQNDDHSKRNTIIDDEIDNLIMTSNHFEEKELYSQCLDCYNKVLSLTIKRYGRSHRRVIDTYCTIGKLQLSSGLFEQSLWSHYQVLKICIERYKDDHLLMAMAYYLVGESIASLDRCESLLFFQQSLEVLLNNNQEYDSDNNFATTITREIVTASQKFYDGITGIYGYFILTLLSSINQYCIQMAITACDIHLITCEAFHLKLEPLDLLAVSEAIISCGGKTALEVHNHLSDEIGFDMDDGDRLDNIEDSNCLEAINNWQRRALIATAASDYDYALQLYYRAIGAIQCQLRCSHHLELYISSQIAALHYLIAKNGDVRAIQHVELSYKMYHTARKLCMSIYPQSYVVYHAVNSPIEKCTALMEILSMTTKTPINV